MNRVLFFLLFIGITTINVSFASAEPTASGKSVKVTIMGDGAFSLVSVHYLVPGVRIVYQSKFLGAGGEIVSFYGQKQDFYLLAFGLVKLGWFHLGLGGSMMVKLPQDQQEIWTSMLLDRLLPAVSLGVNAPIWKIGPGRLGFNASLDAFMSAFPISTEFVSNPPSDFTQNLEQNPPQALWQAISSVIGAGIGGFFSAFFSTFKLTGGLSYIIAF